MKNKVVILLTVLFLSISGILIYLTYRNYGNLGGAINSLKAENVELKNKIEEASKNLSQIDSETSSINAKLDSIKKKEEELKNYENILDTNSKIFELSNYYLRFINLKLDYSMQNELKDVSSNLKLLESSYYDESIVKSKNEAKQNAIYISLKTSYDATRSTNEKIAELSHVIKKREGMIKLLNDNNFFFRERAFKGIDQYKKKYDATFEPKDFLKRVTSILNLKIEAINLYDNVLIAKPENINFVSALRDKQMEEISKLGSLPSMSGTKDEVSKINAIKDSMIFGLDTISQNINYLNGYNILDRTITDGSKNIVLRYLFDGRGRILIIQEKKEGVANLYYFGSDGMPFGVTNLKEFNINYLNRSEKDDMAIINRAMSYLDDLKTIFDGKSGA